MTINPDVDGPKVGARRQADQALVASDGAQLHGLHPSGFDPSRIAATLMAEERRYLIHTPRQFPLDAGIIAYYAGDPGGGGRFAGFAKRNSRLFQRLPNCYGSAFDYRLTPDGCAVADAASGIETEGQDGETRLGAKHESPAPKGDAQ